MRGLLKYRCSCSSKKERQQFEILRHFLLRVNIVKSKLYAAYFTLFSFILFFILVATAVLYRICR